MLYCTPQTFSVYFFFYCFVGQTMNLPQHPAIDIKQGCSSPPQSGVCGCEKGYTEVMTTHGFLDYCTKTPGADNKKADVKTSSGRLKPGPSQIQDFFNEWTLRPVGPGIDIDITAIVHGPSNWFWASMSARLPWPGGKG